MFSNVAKQLLVIETMAIFFSFCICPSHSLNVEQFTEDMVEYFGADLPIILFDRDAVMSPLSLKMAASFIEFDRTEPGMEAEVVKGSCSVLVHFSCGHCPLVKFPLYEHYSLLEFNFCFQISALN